MFPARLQEITTQITVKKKTPEKIHVSVISAGLFCSENRKFTVI